MPKQQTPKQQLRPVRRVFTPQFKEQVVKLSLAGHKCKRDIAEEYDITEGMLYEWIKTYKKYGTFDRQAIKESKTTDVERLEKRIKYLEMENDILKHVALMLKTEGPNSSKSSSMS